MRLLTLLTIIPKKTTHTKESAIMPLINDNFDAPSNPQSAPETIHIASPKFKGITVDSRYTPRQNLLTYITGSKWHVNYYSQVLDTDSGLASHQLSRPGHAQSYRLIQQLLIRVAQGLQDAQDGATKIMTVTGNGVLIAGVIGNVGDVFLADIGDGNEGMFEVTNSEKLGIYKDAVYNIEYALVGYTTPQLIADLTAKTVETVYFRKDYLLYGQKPFIDTSEMEYLHYFDSEVELLTSYYFSRYFDDEYQTLTVPGQTRSTYDPFLAKAIAAYFTTDAAKELNRLRILNIGNQPSADVVTIWDAMLKPHKSNFRIMEPKMNLAYAVTFPAAALMNSIRFTGITFVVYPTQNVAGLDNTENLAIPASDEALVVNPSLKIQATHDVRDELFTGTPYAEMEIIPSVSMGDYYLLSENFYNNTSGETMLEVCARRHIAGEALNPLMLKALLATVYFWSELEKFYFIPMVLILIKQYMIYVN